MVLSADHGGAALPEEWIAAGIAAIRVKPSLLRQGLAAELQTRYGAPLLLGLVDQEVFLNTKAIAEKKLDPVQARRAAAEWLARQPGVAAAVTREEIESGLGCGGIPPALRRGHFPERSGDVTFVLKPFAVLGDEESGTGHGQPYAYDNQVPLVLFGKGVRPGLFRLQAHASDVAPTTALLMEMGAPASAEGEPRAESIIQGR